MEEIKLLYKITWNVAKHHRTTFSEIIGEAYIKWIQTLASYQKEKGALSPYMWAGVTRALSYQLEKERKLYLTQISENTATKLTPQFEMPENLSINAKTIARETLNLWEQSGKSVIPKKQEITSHVLSKGWKWNEIRNSYKELKNYF